MLSHLSIFTSGNNDTYARRALVGLALAQALVYAAIGRLSADFVYGTGFQQRPILLVFALFIACFLLYGASLAVGLCVRQCNRLLIAIVAAAITYRGIMLFSQPIQEIDIYRYLWDGAVTAQGINPFRFTPAEVCGASAPGNVNAERPPVELLRLVHMRDASPGLAEALYRIHYPELTTLYPPVSQAVFAVADRLTPSGATLRVRTTMMKAVLVTFDLATIGLLLWMLQTAGRHAAWVLAYAWCPLVIKEFANSGHLDSIAACLTTASLCCAAKLFGGHRQAKGWWSAAAALLLGLSVGAKLYALVLLPLLTHCTVRRAGYRRGMLFAGIAVCTCAVVLVPMFWSGTARGSKSIASIEHVRTLRGKRGTSGSPADAPSDSSASRSGLAAFLTRWEMNDFLFMLIAENLRPADPDLHEPQAWFAVVPDLWRANAVRSLARLLQISHERAAFLLTRAITAGVFLGIMAILVRLVARENSLLAFLEAAFLTLAWFWLLSPTQNPWYWTWALPLVPFARSRAWLALSGLVFIYYLRFWLLYHYPNPGLLGTPYDGRLFFDLVITWVEYGPWFACLAIGALIRWLNRNRTPIGAANASVAQFTELPREN